MARNSYFQFKQFRIVQEHSAMKVGVDSVLLGSWGNVSGAKRILDVGAGTGLIALMMAQRNPDAGVDAIEIDPNAFHEAKFNVEQSPWRERIKVECTSFQQFAGRTGRKYDLIISNPPYFDNGIKAPLENRAQARHSDSLPLGDLISGIAGLLEKNGIAALVLPIENFQELQQCVAKAEMFMSRLCRIKPNPKKPVFRLLVELTNTKCVVQEEELMIEFDKHFDYTPEYMGLTKEFYLKF